jgi:hypothetical protein
MTWKGSGARAVILASAVGRLFIVLIDNLIPGDVLFDAFILGKQKLGPAAAAVFDLVVDNRLTIGTFFQGHQIIPFLFPGAFQCPDDPEI